MSDELPDDLAQLFSEERRATGPTQLDRDHVRSRVGATLGLSATIVAASTVGASTASAAGATAGAAGAATMAVKIVTALVLVSGGVGGALVWRERSTAAPAPSPTLAMPVAREPAPQLERRQDTPPPQITAPNRPLLSPRPRVPIDAGPRIESQSTLLARASSRLAAGDAEGALAIVAEDEATHPDGPLAEERAVLRVRALWRAGNHHEARTARDAFVRMYPRSLHRVAIDREVTP